MFIRVDLVTKELLNGVNKVQIEMGEIICERVGLLHPNNKGTEENREDNNGHNGYCLLSFVAEVRFTASLCVLDLVFFVSVSLLFLNKKAYVNGDGIWVAQLAQPKKVT